MKKFRPKTTLPAAASNTTAAIFNACSKQETSEPLSTGEQPEMSSADQLVLNKIKNFKLQMEFVNENPAYKSAETMSVDSTKWYLDAVFNYSYAYTEQSFENFNSGRFLLTLQKSGQRIDFNQICQAYDELKQQTLLIYYNTEGNQKELYVSNMKVSEETETSVVIEVTATIGSNTDATPPEFSQWGPFVEGDDWMYGEFLGDCYENYVDERDAATEICDATNTYRYKYIKDAGSGWYAYYTIPSATIDVTVYSDPQNQILFRNPNDPTIDNDRDYYLLYQEKNLPDLTIETCISWEDMNFYYHGTHKVIYDIIQDNYDVFGVSPWMTFYSCEMEGKGIGDDYDPDYTHHKVTATYKTRHVCFIDGRTSLGD